MLTEKCFGPLGLPKQIKAVFDQPGYPKYYPNTFVPEYSASQHMTLYDEIFLKHPCFHGLMSDILETS